MKSNEKDMGPDEAGFHAPKEAGESASSASRRTQAERADTTRKALIAAGRDLFATRGYDEVGAEEIVRAAGLTRGALYHPTKGSRRSRPSGSPMSSSTRRWTARWQR